MIGVQHVGGTRNKEMKRIAMNGRADSRLLSAILIRRAGENSDRNQIRNSFKDYCCRELRAGENRADENLVDRE